MVRDIVGLDLAPPDRALVRCVGEKPQTQAVPGTAPALPPRPGRAERCTHDYRRHGNLDLFAALDVPAGLSAAPTSRRGIGRSPMVVGACQRRHHSVEFRAFLDRVAGSVPPDPEVHLVLDDLKTRKARLIHDQLVERPHFHLHFTPTPASWLDLVACRFALPSRRRLKRGAVTGTGDLEEAIHGHIAETNADTKPFAWTKSTDAILASVARFRQRIPNSER